VVRAEVDVKPSRNPRSGAARLWRTSIQQGLAGVAVKRRGTMNGDVLQDFGRALLGGPDMAASHAAVIVHVGLMRHGHQLGKYLLALRAGHRIQRHDAET
jgi:hypothetical protein